MNCGYCEHAADSATSICSVCTDTHFFAADTDICLGYCATGFRLTADGTCGGQESVVAMYTFSMDQGPGATEWRSE